MSRPRNTVHIYRDNLARARNNVNLALTFEGLEVLVKHKEALDATKKALNAMILSVDEALRKTKGKV